MGIAIYDISIPVFIASLNGLSRVLKKAIKFSETQLIDQKDMLNQSIYEDMFVLQIQVQICTRHPLRMCSLLGELAVPELADDEVDLEQLNRRVEQTIEFLKGVEPKDFDGAENRTLTHTFRSGYEHQYTGLEYLTQWWLPNFYFHLTTAYNIFRSMGVEVTKQDYMGGDLPR